MTGMTRNTVKNQVFLGHNTYLPSQRLNLIMAFKHEVNKLSKEVQN